jgi:ankyrin repeat protein
MSAAYDCQMSALRYVVGFLLLGILASGCSGYSKEQEQEMRRIRDSVTADPTSVNRTDAVGNTPLHLAVINNYLPLMDWLKVHGANPNAKGHYGDTPLHTAVISDRSPDGVVILRLLRMGADVNAPNDYGDTPLHRAAYHGFTDKVRFFLENKADVSRRAQRGETPLLYAARPEGHPDTVLALLDGGADVNAVDNFGITPLHGAAMIGNVEVARVLIDKGADVNRKTLDGSTPLHIAAVTGKTGFVQFLLSRGADRNLRDERNLTPAEAATKFPSVTVSREGKQTVDTSAAVNLLLSAESK